LLCRDGLSLHLRRFGCKRMACLTAASSLLFLTPRRTRVSWTDPGLDDSDPMTFSVTSLFPPSQGAFFLYQFRCPKVPRSVHRSPLSLDSFGLALTFLCPYPNKDCTFSVAPCRRPALFPNTPRKANFLNFLPQSSYFLPSREDDRVNSPSVCRLPPRSSNPFFDFATPEDPLIELFLPPPRVHSDYPLSLPFLVVTTTISLFLTLPSFDLQGVCLLPVV